MGYRHRPRSDDHRTGGDRRGARAGRGRLRTAPGKPHHPVTLRELAATPLLWRDAGSGTRDTVREILDVHGASAPPAVEFGSAMALVAAARRGGPGGTQHPGRRTGTRDRCAVSGAARRFGGLEQVVPCDLASRNTAGGRRGTSCPVRCRRVAPAIGPSWGAGRAGSPKPLTRLRPPFIGWPQLYHRSDEQGVGRLL
ncbi:LysR substrate-binding domain-containing protein [Nocardia sp. NBC_00416]|uniref:LysR substrate-binding domain-containing protein n=1 Tax=Nocardia sp. NBC_00416 TaxID=2975991 RepID=UPI002E1C65D1